LDCVLKAGQQLRQLVLGKEPELAEVYAQQRDLVRTQPAGNPQDAAVTAEIDYERRHVLLQVKRLVKIHANIVSNLADQWLHLRDCVGYVCALTVTD
jgi:hypothetical protein